jgi:dihydrofolate reductase
VISSTLSGALSGVEVYAELQMALSHHASEDVYIIGGQRLYEEGLFFADTMYITHVEQWPDGDAFFPEIDWSKWRKIYEEVHPGFVFAEYRKI